MDQLAEQIQKLDTEEKFDRETDNLNFENDLQNLINDYDKSINRKNNEAVAKILREQMEKSKKRVKWSDSNENIENVGKVDDLIEQDEEEEDNDEEEYSDYEEDYEEYSEENDQKIAEKTQPCVIKIRHTQSDALDELDRINRLSRDKPVLDSPGDIFKVHYKPKSILKNKEDQVSVEPVSSSNLKEETGIKRVPLKEAKNVMNEKFEPEKVKTNHK